jgi:hypothetical protein
MKDEQKTVSLDPYEQGAVIEGLNKIRTEKIQKDECAAFVSDLLLKVIRAPSKKGRRRDEAR